MFTIAIIGQKGGTGKTTLAVTLAATAAAAGQTVAVLDTDPQTNAANWADRRKAENPVVVPTPPGRLRQTLELARENGADLVLIDTPGRQDSTAIAAAKLADLVLVPTAPQVFDLETLQSVREMVQLAGNPQAFLLINKLHPSATTLAGQAKAIAAEVSGMAVCPVHLTQRDIYASAPATGQAPNEIEPEGRAADELRQLYKFISALIDNQESEPHVVEAIQPAQRA